MTNEIFFIRPVVLSISATVFTGRIFHAYTFENGKQSKEKNAWKIQGSAVFTQELNKIEDHYATIEEAKKALQALDPAIIFTETEFPEYPTSDDLRPYKSKLSEEFIKTWNEYQAWGGDMG